MRDANCGRPGVDFSNASKGDVGAAHWPLRGYNGSYSAFIFAAEAQRIIRAHAARHSTPVQEGGGTREAGARAFSKPLYLYLPFQNVHGPVEVPPQYEALYDGVIADPKRKTFAGTV